MFLHYIEHVVVRDFHRLLAPCSPCRGPMFMNPRPLLPSTTYSESEARGLLRQHLHITSGLSRFCGVWSPRNHDVDI